LAKLAFSQKKALSQMNQISFSQLGTPEAMVQTLIQQGIDKPFPIQIDTLPDSLAGRDVLGRGKTGSGKTLAFSIPVVARLAEIRKEQASIRKPMGLVLAPTRELVTQIAATMRPLADSMNLRVATIFGGVSQNPQAKAIREGVEIIVATPGRLEDLMQQGLLKLDAIEITVLDEADHMADLGFLPIVTRILRATPKHSQRLLFSATLDNGVNKIVDQFLNNQVMHSVDEENSPVAQMTHHVFEAASPEAKTQLVNALASGSARRILFMRTKHHAKKLALALTKAGIPAVDLHGNLSQNARDRNLAAFASGAVRVLVATDVAARGVHVDDVNLVIHVDPPAEHKAYLHRSGRTARAGAEGDVVTICLPSQRKDLSDLLKKAQIDVKPIQVTSQSPEVKLLIGEVAPYVKPVAVAKPAQGGGQSQGRNAQRKRAMKQGQLALKSDSGPKRSAVAAAKRTDNVARPASPSQRSRRGSRPAQQAGRG
jgi:superfamily II DNA/RNA helicase